MLNFCISILCPTIHRSLKLRCAAQASEQEIGKLHNRLEMTEQNQRHIMAFLTKAVQEPAFLQQVLGNQPGPQRITEGETAGGACAQLCHRVSAFCQHESWHIA